MPDSSDPVLGIIVALLIGLVIRTFGALIPERLKKVPYTALLLISGTVIGVITAYTHVAYISASLRALETISPSVLFAVFLPALIVPSGLNLRWHVVKRVLDKALLLAVPGTLITAALIALVARYVLPYDWKWSGCFLFGGTLAATDPVAVVSIMHSVGASERLGTIIEGESLLNDGVAYVLFEIFKVTSLCGTVFQQNGWCGSFADGIKRSSRCSTPPPPGVPCSAGRLQRAFQWAMWLDLW